MMYFYEIFAELAINFLKIKSADSAFIAKFIQYGGSQFWTFFVAIGEKSPGFPFGNFSFRIEVI